MVIMWCCQLPSRFLFYIRTRRLLRAVVIIFCVVLYCEFVHYYIVLLWCQWPLLSHQQRSSPTPGDGKPLRAMILGDTHILGSGGHWFDKLRREWQMTRAFQASMLIYNPDVVFILGDLMDEGNVCSMEEFEYHIQRFKRMFQTPHNTRTEIVVGNHDIGFHYRMKERKHNKFAEAFNAPSVKLLQIRDVIFVMVNSMAMEGDGCNICTEAITKLRDIKWKLKCAKGAEEKTVVANVCDTLESFTYSKPILLQHFPMYRPSDSNCTTPDKAPASEIDIPFRERWDCISKEATKELFDMLDPRLVLSAHTHHGCYRVHDNGVPEWTVASYSWRNKPNPTFLLAEINPQDYVINRCFLPNETTVISIYISGLFLLVICLLLPTKLNTGRRHSDGIVFVNKSH